MNQFAKGRKASKSGKKGCLFLIVGSLLALLAAGVFVLVVSRLTGMLIEARHGETAAYALMDIVTPCYGVATFLFYAILAVWYFAPTEEEIKAQNKGLSPMLGQKESKAIPKRVLWLITLGLLVGVVLTGAFCVNTYRLVTPEGISSYCFVETKHYEWKQVSAYTIDCDNDDGLSVTFTMRDGKKFEILQGVNSTTARFDEAYTSVTHFAAVIDENMVELQVPRNVKHVERAVTFYRGYEGLWPYVSKLIGYSEINPSPDETAPVTESPTEAITDAEAAQ